LRRAVRTLGLELLPAEEIASDTVTAVRYPEGVGDPEVRDVLKDQWGIVVAGGQGPLKGRIFRVAHMAYVRPAELVACVVALESCLARVSGALPTGAAAGAFAEAFLS
jgi:aspartate aminotransferase-like enzyme